MAAEKQKPNETSSVLVASVIYILMNKSYHISRNVRAQWFLHHVNSSITLSPSNNVPETETTELLVISVLPQDPPDEWSVETRHKYRYLVTASSNIIFLSEVYSTVYCLDLSPSISAVDIQHGEVMLDEILSVLDESLKGVVSPLTIPGSSFLFEPQIFVTVIVHTPFYTTPAQQVLVQGWQVTPENLVEFLAAIRKQLQLLEDTIADVAAVAYDQLEAVRIRQMESDRLVGGLFEESSEKQLQMSTSEIPMVSPDSGFINLLRYGMLALRLLPHSSLSNLVVVTDGVISLPDIHVLDLVLTQLRTNAVAVSFLHVGSQFHPHCAQGLVPYSELMQFISCATFGTYIPLSATRNYGHGGLNTYHEAFLTWSFKKGASVHELTTPVPRSGEWFVSNQNFYGNREPQLLVKKQTEDEMSASLTTVLCCRLHEGFMIKNINVKENQLELNLMLPWANHIYIEYVMSCEWPNPPNSSVRFSISIKAPYEFLHDITCLMKKQFESPYRQAVVTRFWLTIKTLAQSDLLLAHLDSFSNNTLSFTLPESIRSGMPLFYLPSNNGPPTLSSSDPSCPQFAHFWRPVCLLDPSVWHKWLHTHTLSLTLQHDLPLPRYLHMPSPNGRFQGLLCRHAAATLYNFLKDWTSFVLIENHTYLKFLSASETDKTPSWFYIVRVQLKAPCAVIHIAFLGGTPGKLRHQILEQLKEKISALTIPQRLTNKETSISRNQIDNFIENQTRSNVPCCILLNKPLEKILIRYERMPSEFGTVVFPDGTQPQTDSKPPRPTSSLVTTLSRYLHHRRWIWTASAANHNLGVPTVSRILAILTQMRLQEGFRFAHSTAGIINMVLEIQMKCCDQDADHMCDNCRPSIIQYVLFPVHVISHTDKGSTSEEDETELSESESSMELITECWIEPQHGVVAKCPPQRAYMENLPYQQLADVMWRMDVECISNLLTFEQLCLMSQNPLLPSPPRVDPLEIQPRNPLENWPHATALSDQRIQRIPFPYNVINILPESQQVELEFPMFIQDLGEDHSVKNPADAPNILLMETLFMQLKSLHDKELFLSQAESKLFVESIFKRQRDIQQHPLPFPRRQSWDSSSGKKTLEKDTKEADKENDSPKTQSEETTGSNSNLVGQSQISSKMKMAGGTVPGTPESAGGVRKGCGPLYRMYPHVSPQLSTPRSTDVERDTPKWRFFVKRVSQNYTILTFVPASYRDCKTLMLGANPKACTLLSESMSNIIKEDCLHAEQTEEEKKVVLESTLNPEAKPFQPGVVKKDSNLSVLNCSSPLSNRGWVLDNLDSVSNVFEPAPSVSDFQNNSSWELNKGNLDPSSPFRLRARSWEPMKPQSVLKTKKHASHRIRTRSVGSKGKWMESKLRKKLLYDSDTISMLSSNAPTSKPVFGSINVPVYVYGCSSENLMDAVILKSEYEKTFKDLFWKRTVKLDIQGKLESDDLFEDDYKFYVQDAYDDSGMNQEFELRQHAKAVTQVFNKSFGVSLFKSLHMGYNIHSLNVQTAMEECEEALVEISITDYIQTVCKHLKELKDELGSGDSALKSEVALSMFSSPAPCQEYRHLHKLIKNKFLNIITTCFKPIYTNPDYYFCSPTWERVQVDINTTLEDRKTLEVSHDYDTTFQSEVVEFRSDQGSAVGAASPWDGLGSVTTPEEIHTSMLSNMDSDSVSIFQEEESDEDISPLFLQLVCTIQSKGQMGNCTVRILPTCMGELVDFLNYPEKNVDVQNMSVTLDMLCLTLSQPPKPVIVPTESQLPNLVSPNTSNDEQFPTVSLTIDNLQHLPDYQHKAISLCVEEIKWLMRDEIAAFLLDTYPVSETTLQLVADHVSSSANRSSCIMQIIPLQFYCNAEQSLLMFLQDFSMLQVTGYCLKKENEFYYLVKDKSQSSDHRDSQDSGQSLSTAPDLWVSSPNSGDDSKAMPGSPISTSEARVDLEPRTSGWSSIAAWHAEVAHLMEAGIVPCDVMDGKEGEMDEYSGWLKELESKRQVLPNFWLVMRVNQESVTVFFHCRYLELDTAEVKLYSLVQKNVVSNIKSLCKTVNQKMLLNNLHDTRMCNVLLEPESVEDAWNSNQSSSQPAATKPEEGVEVQSEESETPVDTVETVADLVPGWFSCPVVWETNFSLHPRLKTGPSKPGLSRGLQALRTVLNRFSVNNRKNMFVYQDHSGNVFYLRLYENVKTINKTLEGEETSLGSVSRSSSINSLNTSVKKADDTSSSIVSAVSRELRPRVKSFGEVGDTARQEEYLTLKVHGISEAGPEVKCELVQVLHNRLDDAVLEVLSLMLARNPMCKLSPEDVHFIQKPQRLPETTVQYSLPPAVHDNLQAVFYYFHQNLLQFLHTPKYTDTRSQFHFQDYSNPEEPSRQMPESQMFLYNQSTASGNKGIACVAIGLVDMDSNIIESLSYQRPTLYSGELDPLLLTTEFNTLTTTNPCQPEDKAPVRIEFRIWKQGRVNMEQLILKLKSVVRHALWDLIMEYQLLTIPLFNSSSLTRENDVGEEPLNPVFSSVVTPWLQFGCKLGVPAVSSHTVTLQQRHPVNVTMKEVSNLVSTDGTTAFTYYQQDEDYLPYNSNISSSRSIPYSGNCLLIARNMDQWRATVSDGARPNTDKLEPKAQKVLQKFSPLLMTTVGETVQFVPRQRFLVAVLTNDKVLLYTYNWAKDLIEMLMKQLALLGQWLTARSNVQLGVIQQKMGLFINQPISRKTENQAANPFMNQMADVENLMVFPGTPRGPRSSSGSAHLLQEVLRDTKPVARRSMVKRPVVVDHVLSSLQQLLDTRAQDKRGHQKKLYTMWQTRGATPNIPIAEDVLEVFMLYSRVIHYCVTPLLFLPRWRIQSASTRDFSLRVHKSISQTSLQESVSVEEKWHLNLCASFINEYKQYLQSLGFIPIQVGPATPKKGVRGTKPTSTKEGRTVCYLQKSLLGGILLFELYMCEPFFYTKLHALECSRLEGKASSGLISQFTLSFLDECDRMKVLMHLHSFTYDYHLRTLTRFISREESLLPAGYHLTSFLDDFLKYYSKAPNYAYSLVHSGNLVIPKISSPTHLLFSYLLNHEDDYPMKIMSMVAPGQELDDKSLSSANEYVLIQRSSSSQLMYRDIQDNKQVYEYDIVLIVASEESPDPTVLRLRYFILLTSRRHVPQIGSSGEKLSEQTEQEINSVMSYFGEEPYAKLENERKLGKFRTVSTANPLIVMGVMSRETTPPSSEDLPEELLESHHSSPTVQLERRPSTQFFEIKQETVNYLGYYSSHEQFMQQLILEQAQTAKKNIEEMIAQVSLHCRTHFLWNKLMTGMSPTYAEFCELLSLGHTEAIADMDPRVSSILAQPVSWYQGLIKLLMTKYADHYRTFLSLDCSLQYFLVLHPRIPDGFIMVTVNFNAARGELSVVTNRILREKNVSNAFLPGLIEDVINACCFQLWTGLL
ncbi:KICSTOR complex protein SZT2-like isoform X2 [Homalodisca vitripennis]|uniref:KICSTOR complex protein SZT2-like isoform X2 n=1 Tax=Homalodisca vitripennis TaxID=197043 RepID=UPI001EEC1FBB|nr:KICSTOR complex protein SZT2-like isoform X2 [Homalodisca vitripennis]